MPRAILSVSDKTGLADFARGLAELGWELVSTGGTARVLREAGLDVADVSEITAHPEMMDGRVKTLHPAVHAGILARAGVDDAALAEHGYAAIDLVAVNLYPFRETVARGADLDEAVENIDIGGPTMLRSAAKNHDRVLVVVDPADYGRILDALRAGAVDGALKRDLARKVFDHTSSYDRAITDYLEGVGGGDGTADGADAEEASPFPGSMQLSLRKVQDLRYGENPDQPAAFYAESDPPAGSLPEMEQLHGKALSFNNLIDIEGAVMGASAWPAEEATVCCIIKHTTPCGLALGDDALDAYQRALACDPTSAFGGIVALNVPVSARVAEAMNDHFLEVIVAPAYDQDALPILEQKKNRRLIRLPVLAAPAGELDLKRVRGGLLAQHRMAMRFPEDAWSVATDRAPTDGEWAALRFAWRAAAVVKSNAIVLVKGRQTVGIGAGQMSRVDASRIAVMKAHDQDVDVNGAVLASDAYFPFRDGVDAAAEAGATAVIQPGGSIRDDEVVEAANEHGLAMVFTGRRVFRH